MVVFGVGVFVISSIRSPLAARTLLRNFKNQVLPYCYSFGYVWSGE